MEDKIIITGRNPVREYLKNLSSETKATLTISDSAHGKIIQTIAQEAESKRVTLNFKGKEFFSNLGNAKHQGVCLEILSPGETSSGTFDLADIARKKGLIILLDNITDPHNTGAIIRSAEALGAMGVVWGKDHSSGLTETAIKSSAGAAAHIPTRAVTNIARFLREGKDAGFWIIGTSDHGTATLEEASSLKPAIVVIGSEGKGMRRLTEEQCDRTISIPLRGTVSSLNASVAAGIILYELLKKTG